MPTILYNAHVVPAREDCSLFYINNYINQDQYNTLFKANWLIERLKAAKYWGYKIRQLTQT